MSVVFLVQLTRTQVLRTIRTNISWEVRPCEGVFKVSIQRQPSTLHTKPPESSVDSETDALSLFENGGPTSRLR